MSNRKLAKGGDGGVAPQVVRVRDKQGTYYVGADGGRVRSGNDREVIAGADLLPAKEARQASILSQCFVPTDDPADRAHAQRDHQGRYVPAVKDNGAAAPISGAKQRKYPPSEMVLMRRGGRIVVMSEDSAFDQEWIRRQNWLIQEGIPDGLHGSPVSAATERALNLCRARRGAEGVRNLTRRKPF